MHLAEQEGDVAEPAMDDVEGLALLDGQAAEFTVPEPGDLRARRDQRVKHLALDRTPEQVRGEDDVDGFSDGRLDLATGGETRVERRLSRRGQSRNMIAQLVAKKEGSTPL